MPLWFSSNQKSRSGQRRESVRNLGSIWIYLDLSTTYPAGYREGHRYPLVLAVHGGPASSSRERFGLLSQVIAAHGWFTETEDPKLLFDVERSVVWKEALSRRSRDL